MSARDFDVEVGAATVPCRLPLMPTRLALLEASERAKSLPEEQRGFVQPAVFWAALGACMRTPPECGRLVQFSGNVAAYGEAVGDELCEGDPDRLPDLVRAGGRCLRAIVDSLPTKVEVENAERPTDPPAETSTGGTSASA